MDKLVETPWFVKIISLLLAALLFISVNFEADKNSIGFNTPAQTSSEVVESVPVEVYYDQDNLVVSGVPDTVNVTLTGPKNLIIAAKNQLNFKAYIDLSDPEIELGNQTISVKIRDLNEKISYKIDPEIINISIQEKITSEFDVNPEFDRSLLKEGYIAEEPTVKPGTVKITGAKDIVENIAYVKANISIEDGVFETIYKDAQVQAFDKDLNKLDVTIQPSFVTVEVPIVSPSKSVGVKPVSSGKAKEGIEIVSMSAEPKEITLYGKRSVLDAINELQVPIDISKVEEDTELRVKVNLPKDVTSASAKEIKVNVKVRKVESSAEENSEDVEEETMSKTFSDIPIGTLNLREEYELVFLDPREGKTNVSVVGSPSILDNLQTSDISVSINVKDLLEGEHTAPLSLQLPNDLQGETLVSTAKFFIARNSDDNSTEVDGDEAS